MSDHVRPTTMTDLNDPVRIDTQAIRLRTKHAMNGWSYDRVLTRMGSNILELCDEIDLLRGELASAEFKIRRQECLDALKAAIEKARQTGGHSHG